MNCLERTSPPWLLHKVLITVFDSFFIKCLNSRNLSNVCPFDFMKYTKDLGL